MSLINVVNILIMAEAVAPGPVAGLRPPQPLNVTDTNMAEN